MRKLISVLMVLILLLTACSSPSEPIEQPEANEPGSTDNSEPVISETEPEIDYDFYTNLPTRENEYELPSSYDDELCFTFEIPDFSGKDTSELPYLFENPEWCINGTEWVQLDEEKFDQILFKDNEEAVALAKAIALLTPHHGLFTSNYGSKTFDSITEANEKELLWAAICRTPLKKYSENENHAYNFVSDYIDELTEYSWVICETISVTDVEKTFRWLFGEEANFVPQNIEMFGIRYIEELGVFVQFFDGILMAQVYPQIISYSENNGIYTVETIGASALIESLPDIGLSLKLTDGTYLDLPLNKENVTLVSEIVKPYVFTFEKADDGHFILTGFSY